MFWLIIFSVAYAGSTENPHPTYQSDPVLKGFRSQTLNPGDNLTLSCTLSGLGDKEKVRFTWERNGEIVQDSLVSIDSGYSGVVWYSRVYLEQVTGATGAGWWKCKAGALSETARIDVAGSTKLLNPENTLGVERESGELNRVGRIGEDIVLYCPYQGTPPTQFTWWTKGRRIGESTRFRFPEPGLLRVLNLTVSEQGTYTCRAKVQEGEDLSGSIQLTVIVSPVLRPFSFWSGVVEGGRARVSCEAVQGSPPLLFSWSNINQTSQHILISQGEDGFSSTLSIPVVSRSDAGLYTCTVNNSAGSTQYTTVLTVNYSPEWVAPPQDSRVTLGSRLVLDCRVRGEPKPEIEWTRRGAVLNPVTWDGYKIYENGTLEIISTRLRDQGEYTCSASNSVLPHLSRSVQVQLNVGAYFYPEQDELQGERREKVGEQDGSEDIDDETLKDLQQSIRVRSEERVILSCNPHGDPPLEIYWFRDNKPIPSPNHRFKIKNEDKNGTVSKIVIRRSSLLDSGVFVCTARNRFGEANKTFHLLVQDVPGAIEILHILDYSSRSVNLSWSSPSDNNSPISAFLISARRAAESWESSIEERVHGNIQSTVLSGLNPDTFYSFRVQAENSLGSGYPSPVQSIRTSQDAPGGAPEQVSVKPTSSQSLLVTWRAPKPELRHGLIQGYNIFYASLESTDIQGLLLQETISISEGEDRDKIERFELKGLRKFTEYSIYLEAYNQVGTSPKSSPSVIARTLEDAPSAPPNRVECSGLDSTSLQVSWFEPSPVHIHGLLQGYFIFYSPLLEWEESPSVENLTTRARSEKISGLARWQNYTVSVSAYNRAGLGVRSRPIYCSTLESLPGAPANIKTISVSSNSVLVTWLPPIHPNGRITLYKVYMKTMLEGQPFTELTEVYPSETSKVFEKLNPGQPYSWSVTALTIVGEGPRSDTVTETPLYQGEKGPEMLGFSKFLIQAEGDNLELSCRNIGNPPARIDWEYNGDKLENIEMSRGGRPSNTLLGSLRFDSLRVENSGNYTCSATNKLGRAQIFYSLQVKLSRSNGVVPYPPTLRIVTVNQTSITLSWDTHPTGGSSILNYRIYFRREAGSWEEKHVSISSFSPTIYPYLETVGNLKCGSRHFFQISATNDFGTSSRSTEISTLTLGSPPIAPPQEKLLYMNPGSNLVLLLESWKDGGCPISSFVVEYREGSQDWHLLSNLLSPETKSLTISDRLESGKDYQLRMTAHNSAGSTRHTYTLFADSINGANPSLIIGVGSTGRYTGWMLLAAFTITSIAMLAFLIRRRQKRVPQTGSVPGGGIDLSNLTNSLPNQTYNLQSHSNHIPNQTNLLHTQLYKQQNSDCDGSPEYYLPVDTQIMANSFFEKYEDPDSFHPYAETLSSSRAGGLADSIGGGFGFEIPDTFAPVRSPFFSEYPEGFGSPERRAFLHKSHHVNTNSEKMDVYDKSWIPMKRIDVMFQ